MLGQAKQMYSEIIETHKRIYDNVISLRTQIPNLNLGELADLACAMRETLRMLEDVEKSIKEVQKSAEKFCTLSWMNESQISGEQYRIKTKYCSAEPKIKQFPKFPSKRRYNPEAFDRIMQGLGIPQELIESEIVRPNWEPFTDWFSTRQQAGLPVPEGIDPSETYTEYSLSIRKLKDVLDEE
jgi:hypothetical protein